MKRKEIGRVGRFMRAFKSAFERREFDTWSSEKWWAWLNNPWILNKNHMNYELSMTVDVFNTCVQVIAETCATLPCFLYQRTEDGGKVDAVDEPEYDIFKNVANPMYNQTSVSFWETLLMSAAATGNGYAYIERQTKGPGAGKVKALWNLHPDDVTVCREGSTLYYRIMDRCNPDFKPVILFPGDVLHLSKFALNGLIGLSPIQAHKHTLLTSKRQSEWQSKFFEQGIMPRGMLATDSPISQDDMKAVGESWNAIKSDQVVVMPFGLQYKPITMRAEDVEIVQQYNLTERQICGWMRVPLEFVQNHENSTYSNAEQNDLNLIKHCIRPWIVRLEKAIEAQILTPQQRSRGLFVKFKLDALYRGNLLERYQAHQIAINGGFKTRNEVRFEEDYNPLEGLDDPLVPLNMVAEGEDMSEENADPTTSELKKMPRSWVRWFRNLMKVEDITGDMSPEALRMAREKDVKPLVIDDRSQVKAVESPVIPSDYEVKATRKRLIDHEYRKVFERERAEVMKAAAKMTAVEFDAWLKKFAATQEQYCRKNLTPIVVDVCEKLSGAEVALEAKTYSLGMQARLREVLSESKDWAEFPVNLEAHYAEMDESRRNATISLVKKMDSEERKVS